MKYLCLGLPVLLVWSLSGCSKSRGQEGKAPNALGPVVVSTAKAEQRELVDRLNLAGTITPYEQVTLYAKVAGYLRSIKIDIGDHVYKGELLAEIDVPELNTALVEKQALVLKSEAALDQARAGLEQSYAEMEFADISYKRLKAIHDRDRDVLPQQDVDQARANDGVTRAKWKSAETQVKVAEAALAGARAELATLQTMIQYARIEAPMTGVVSERFVDPGALIQVASSSRTQAAPVISIARFDRLRVIVDVPEPSAPFVRPGTAATIEVASISGQPLPASISRVGGVLAPASRTMRVEIDLSNRGERLRPGMTAQVSLALRKMANAVIVPVSALRVEGSERALFVVEGSSARLIRVKTGIETPEFVQIVDGLRGGEQVVIAAAGALKEGEAVSVRP
jgi:RND family efflux transporter MFP subunit